MRWRNRSSKIVKAPLGWSVFADNVKIGGVYDSRGAALEAARIGRILHRQQWRGRADHRAGRGSRKTEMGNAVRHVDGRLAIEERALAHCRKRRPVRAVARGKTRMKAIAQF